MPSTLHMRGTLRHHLVKDPAVFALVDGRVFGAHGRDSEDATRNHPTVILELNGGRDMAQAATGDRGFYLYAYSTRSPDEALRIYEAAKAVVHRKGLCPRLDAGGAPYGATSVYSIEQGAPEEGFNDAVQAWFVRGSYQVWGFGE